MSHRQPSRAFSSPPHVVAAIDLVPDRDVVLCLPRPINNNNNSGVGRRIPIRAAGGGNGYIQYVPNTRFVASESAADRLRRLVVAFPEGHCHGLRTFPQGDGTNVLMSFAVFDPHRGPTPDQSRALARMDRLAEFLTDTLARCDVLRRAISVEGVVTTAEPPSHLYVVRPPSADGATRYCSVKVTVPNNGITDAATKWLTPAGKPVPFDCVRDWQNFRVVPYVTIEEIYIGAGGGDRRYLQLRLCECIVHPPQAISSGGSRLSAAFPGQRCRVADPDDATHAVKRQNLSNGKLQAEEDEGRK